MATHTEPTRPADSIDLNDEAAVRRWVDYFGITISQLQEAVQAAGNDAQAVKRHLLEQGSSAGAG